MKVPTAIGGTWTYQKKNALSGIAEDYKNK